MNFKIEQLLYKIVPTVGAAVVALGMPGISEAATFTEQGDAGVFPRDIYSQTVQLAPDETLEGIHGTFKKWSDIDMFKISLSQGWFSAKTDDGVESGTRWLFLFDENGLGLAANRGNGTETLLEGEILTAGNYYLGIGSGRNYRWSSNNNPIFTANDYNTTTFGASGSGASAQPNSVGRSGPVNIEDNRYKIAISQSPKTVPEPMTILALGAIGLFGITTIRKGNCKEIEQ